MRRVAAGSRHSAAITDEGELYTWVHDEDAFENEYGAGAETGLSLYAFEGALCPECVYFPGSMRIVSVTAGDEFTVVATDEGVARHPLPRLHLPLGSRRTAFQC
jgi:alpha-tubulin suppressor-like RCC1 family protein